MADTNAVVEVDSGEEITVDLENADAGANGAGEAVSFKDLKDAAQAGKKAVAEGDKAPATPAAKATPTEPSAADEAAAKLSDATKRADEERRLREAAEATARAERMRADDNARLAEQREQEAAAARESAHSSQIAAIAGTIETATRQIATEKAEIRRAMEAGDFEKVADAQARLAEASSDLSLAKQRKADLEQAAQRVTHEGRVQPQVQQSPFERYLAAGRFSPRAQSWLRTHQECAPVDCGGDATKNAAMMEGHYAAVKQGIPQGSDDYFRIIEEHTGYRAPVSAAAETKPAGGAEEATPAAPTPRASQRKAQPSAPPSREAPSPSGAPSGRRSVTLNKDEQEAAKLSWPHLPPQQAYANYARNKVELEAEGKLGRTTH